MRVNTIKPHKLYTPEVRHLKSELGLEADADVVVDVSVIKKCNVMCKRYSHMFHVPRVDERTLPCLALAA